MAAFIGYGEALAAFSAATGEHVTAVSRFHAGAEAVLVATLTLRRLVGTFHDESNCELGRQRYEFRFTLARGNCRTQKQLRKAGVAGNFAYSKVAFVLGGGA